MPAQGLDLILRLQHCNAKYVEAQAMTVLIQWLHVLGGIFWFGSALYAMAILGPAMRALPLATRREVMAATTNRMGPVVEAIGTLTIALGVIRGTVLGPVQSIDVVTDTAYGRTWAIALLLGLGILAWSHFMIVPTARRMIAAMTDAASGEAAMRRGMPVMMVELVGFAAIFTCMILMRFGL
jgi:uncharacterized membrane protein